MKFYLPTLKHLVMQLAKLQIYTLNLTTTFWHCKKKIPLLLNRNEQCLTIGWKAEPSQPIVFMDLRVACNDYSKNPNMQTSNNIFQWWIFELNILNIHLYYTLGKKGCYTPIEDNKTNVDRTFVFPLGWNWHDMDPWLFPNEIRHYLGQTFNARSSGIVELRNHSIGGRSPKSIFTLWQLWINICIFFQKFFWLCSNNAPSNPYGY